MDIQFFNSNEVPQPRDKVRIEELIVTPYPDRFRVQIVLKITPFQERPNLILSAHDERDKLVGELDIIETMHVDMEFTLHIRNVDDPAGMYTLTADLFYETRNPPQDQQIVVFTIPDVDAEDSL